jgi:hypothetical protein
MQHHSVRVFPDKLANTHTGLPDASAGSPDNKPDKSYQDTTDEEMIIRLNVLARKYPFCRYRKGNDRVIL